MATPFNSNCFCNAIIASGKWCYYEYFLKTVLLVKKFAFFCIQFLRFSVENKLQPFKNRSTVARADQNDIKFACCMKNWFLGFIIPLISHLEHEERHVHNHNASIQQQKIIKTE